MKLVKEGSELQKRTQHIADDKVSEVSDTVSKMAHTISKQASGSWDKLEQIFEDRVSRSLNSLGVPTQSDMQNLTKRVEELSKTVAALTRKKPAAPRAAARKTVARPPVKRTAKKATK